ncbi:protein of unknown function [Nitrosotalea devaniterrae]|uniref:DUF4145 domain-containing protein n=1 Tax=Nitrosotalea devaniterrae TaxID=1078905 RepID=A0A128A2R5_9ARCH|nr:protein of unknown function [Candidatus Nitrosotalea devanaterra]
MPEPKTLKQLRDLAELNLCDRCKPVYSQLLEPNIKSIVEGYFYYWKDMEWRVTVMVMKLEGAFKKSSFYLNIDSDFAAKNLDEINFEAYEKVNDKSLKWKIDYLHEKGIIGDSSHKLLDRLRLKRNEKIHQPFNDFVEQDLVNFMYGAHVIQNIWLTIFAGFEPQVIENMRNSVEKLSEMYYDMIVKTI